jgi:hypothetical protein
VNVEGLGSLAAEPDPPPRNSGGMKPSTVAGSGPNTRNPAGGADGVWVGSVGGSLPKLAIGQRRSGGVLAQLAINHLVARRSGEVQAVFPFSERSEHVPPVRGTGTPEGDLFGCVRPKEEVDPPVAPTRTTGGPGVSAAPGQTPLHPRPHNTRDYRLDPKPPRARRVVVVRLAVGASAYLSGWKRCNDFGPSL